MPVVDIYWTWWGARLWKMVITKDNAALTVRLDQPTIGNAFPRPQAPQSRVSAPQPKVVPKPTPPESKS